MITTNLESYMVSDYLMHKVNSGCIHVLNIVENHYDYICDWILEN